MRLFTLLTAVMLLLVATMLNAQDRNKLKKTSVHKNTQWYQLMKQPGANYNQVTEAFESYFLTHEHVKSLEELEYKRWLKSCGTNFDSEGQLYSYDRNDKESKSLLNQHIHQRSRANWTVIGPTKTDWEAPMGSSHTTQGVILSVTQAPDNPDKVLLGSVSGGIWYSTDNGANWENKATNLLVDMVNGIAFAPTNTQIVYAATNAGPIKSEDGGSSWSYTSLDFSGSYPGGEDPKVMMVHPADPQTAFYASTNGFWKTTNGGENWTKTLIGCVWDAEIHPTNPDTLYASLSSGGNTYFKRSVDGGLTWTNTGEGYSSSKVLRLVLAVSKAAPSKVFAFAGDNAANRAYIYVSDDNGEHFERKTTPNMLPYDISGNSTGLGQCTWDMALAASDTDPNFLLAGGIFVWKSTDGGNTWTGVDPGHPQSSKHWYHWDCQGLAIFGEKSWLVNDGGAFLSTDKLTTTTNKSFGIYSQEIWGFDTGWKTDIMALGLYHGPVQIKDDKIYDGWYIAPGADAGTVQVNKGDDKYIYARPWDCTKITRSTNKMTAPSSANLNANLPFYIYPIEIANHSYYNTFYTIDDREVKKTTNNAQSWVSMKKFPGVLRRITTSYSNEATVAIVQSYKYVFITHDGGINWEEITPSSTLTKNKNITNITIDSKDENTIWISFGGKQSDVKVLKTTNKGNSWTDYSEGLPSFAINSIVHQIGTAQGVYAATDAGVYYRNSNMTEWAMHSTGLPVATKVHFLRINYAKQKVRIGTLRGIWEGNLYEESDLVVRPIVSTKGIKAGGTLQYFDHSTSLDGATFEWKFEGGSPEVSEEENPQVTYYKPGTYSVTLKITDSRGTKEETFKDFIVVGDTTPPTQPQGLATTNITGTSFTLGWQHSTDNVGVIGYNLYFNSIKLGTVKTTSFDFTNLEPETEYEVFITALDDMGNESVASQVISITLGAGSNNDPIGQSLWTLHAVSSQETAGEDGAAKNAFDGNPETYWHTEWSNSTPSHPHMLDINLNQTYVITQLSYTPRQNGVNGRIKDYEIYVSKDGGNWGNAVSKGTWTNSEEIQTASISKAIGQYIRLKALSEVNGGAWATVAEINLKGGKYNSKYDEYTGLSLAYIYPNPASDGYINIETPGYTGNIKIIMTSLTGHVVHQTEFSSNGKFNLNLSNISAGVYILSVNFNNKTEVRKLLIQ